MFFGLTNSPATFQAMMNALYRDTIRKHESRGTTIRIYMDDIAIATKDFSLPLHEAAVSDVLQVAKDNSLFFKLSKSVFHASVIDYLGVVLETGKTRMDPAKVSGVRDWPTPKCLKDVRSFHGFCNFYWAFIEGFSKLAFPLNALTKKGHLSCGRLRPNKRSTHSNRKSLKSLSSSTLSSPNRSNSKSTPQDSP